MSDALQCLTKMRAFLATLPLPDDSAHEQVSALHAELADFDGYVAGRVETLLDGGDVNTNQLQPDENLRLRLEAVATSGSPGAADAQNYLDYLEELHGALVFARAVAGARVDRAAGREPEKEFLREVETAFADLIASGHLCVAESICDEEHFGNAIVELAGAKFHVRLITDRGEVCAEITTESPKPHGGNWVSLPDMIRAVGIKDELPDPNTLDTAAALVKRYGAEIESGISRERIAQTRAALQRIQAAADQNFKLLTMQLQRERAENNTTLQDEPRDRQRKMPMWIKVLLGIEHDV